jgi:hypothetical protein
VLPTQLAQAVGLGCGSAKWPARHHVSVDCVGHANPTRQGRQLAVPLRMYEGGQVHAAMEEEPGAELAPEGHGERTPACCWCCGGLLIQMVSA